MPPFSRSFAVDSLAKWDANNPGNAVRALFDWWALPGERSTATAKLRLGLRAGYLNFYVKGQSVAKLSCGAAGPRLSVHKAYVTGRRKSADDATPPVDGYEDFGADALAAPSIASLIAEWITTAETYASAEKRFVDDLIAANPGVIDIEMGLPASDLPAATRVAPRMDLVLAQRASEEALSICFWEAKCANNPELRASGDLVARVVGQVDKYVQWMAEGLRISEVQQAYQNVALSQLGLYRLFRDSDANARQCVTIWEELAALDAPSVAVRPGVVIGNYWPEGHREQIASQRMAQCAASFARNGHRAKLQSAGIQVHEVGPDHDGPELPFLSPSIVPA